MEMGVVFEASPMAIDMVGRRPSRAKLSIWTQSAISLRSLPSGCNSLVKTITTGVCYAPKVVEAKPVVTVALPAKPALPKTKELILQRELSADDGTFGTIDMGDRELYVHAGSYAGDAMQAIKTTQIYNTFHHGTIVWKDYGCKHKWCVGRKNVY